MIVREATLEDVPRVLELTVRFIRSSRYQSVVQIDLTRLESLTKNVITSYGVILLAVQADQVVGMLVLIDLPHPLAGPGVVEELAWWVEPEHRKGRAAHYLLRAGEAWTRQKGHSVLKMLAPSDTSVGEMYLRRGYAPLETSYLKFL